MTQSQLRVSAPEGIAEVRPGDDLVGLLLSRASVADGDVVLVTSKVVSKSEGRLRHQTREELVREESVRTVARRGSLQIVRNRLGLTMAAAGIDNSNVAPGWSVLLPLDPDESASRLRSGILDRAGRNVAVIVTDTAGRPWREGQTDIAIGAAGLRVFEDYHDADDGYGNSLVVTRPAVADELAGAGELAQNKLGQRPFAVISGRPDLVLPPGEDGEGAVALVRVEGEDLFGWGAREAVVEAIAGVLHEPFGAAADVQDFAGAVERALGIAPSRLAPAELVVTTSDERVVALVGVIAMAYGWVADPRTPGEIGYAPRRGSGDRQAASEPVRGRESVTSGRRPASG